MGMRDGSTISVGGVIGIFIIGIILGILIGWNLNNDLLGDCPQEVWIDRVAAECEYKTSDLYYRGDCDTVDNLIDFSSRSDEIEQVYNHILHEVIK